MLGEYQVEVEQITVDLIIGHGKVDYLKISRLVRSEYLLASVLIPSQLLRPTPRGPWEKNVLS